MANTDDIARIEEEFTAAAAELKSLEEERELLLADLAQRIVLKKVPVN